MLKNAAMATFSAGTPEKLKPLLEKGMSYPEALQQSIAIDNGPIIASVFDGANNTLAVEYLRAMKVLGIDLEAFTVKREGASHDGDDTSESIASGAKIREMIEDEEDISSFVPKDTAEMIDKCRENENLAYFDNLERELLYIVRSVNAQFVLDTPDVAQGLENRIVQVGRSCVSLDEFLEKVNTKRYTLAKFRRILLNMYLGIKSTDLQVPPPYGRILAFNERGAEIIKAASEQTPGKYTIPFSSSLKDLIDLKAPPIMRFAELTCRSSDLYTLASRNIRPCASDFTTKIEISK